MPRLLLINQLVALIVSYIVRSSGSLFENFVFSNVIGFCCYTLIRVARAVIWPKSEPSTLAFYFLCLTLSPFGFLAGTTISAAIFSYRLENVFSMQRSYVITFVTLTSVISLIAAWSFWNRAKMTELSAAAEAEKARAASIEKQAMQTQLQLLQAQIEPHMLFNTLANLQGLIAIDTDRAQHMLAQLIVYLRVTLSSARAENTTLKQEFSLMEAYLELLSIRMGKRLRYTLDLPADLAQTRIAPMLLQPLVENAIRHGVEPKMEGGVIQVKAEIAHGILHLSVADTGLGLPFDYDDSRNVATSDGHHVGNANIRERLQALYGPQAKLTLENNLPEGTIAHLYIPIPI
ncbi:MAG: histidine kinase [Burkholderiales bacterium]|nr:histidine kinase [Burkholderiales bacterium]